MASRSGENQSHGSTETSGSNGSEPWKGDTNTQVEGIVTAQQRRYLGMPPKVDENSTTVEKKLKRRQMSRRNKVVAWTAGISLAAVGAGFVGFKSMNNNDHLAPAGPVAAAEASPSPTITAEATPKVDVEDLRSMSFESFYLLDRQEQLVFVAAGLKDMDGYIGQGGQEIGKYNPLDIADINNSGTQIVEQWQYTRTAAFLQRDMTDLVSFDKDSAKKMLAGAYYYTGLDTQVTTAYVEDMKRVDAAAERTTLIDTFTVTNTTEVATGVDRNNTPIKYRDISFTENETGTLYTGRFVYTEYQDKSGATHGQWLVQQFTNPGTSFNANY